MVNSTEDKIVLYDIIRLKQSPNTVLWTQLCKQEWKNCERGLLIAHIASPGVMTRISGSMLSKVAERSRTRVPLFPFQSQYKSDQGLPRYSPQIVHAPRLELIHIRLVICSVLHFMHFKGFIYLHFLNIVIKLMCVCGRVLLDQLY